jgi:hypothetical protein
LTASEPCYNRHQSSHAPALSTPSDSHRTFPLDRLLGLRRGLRTTRSLLHKTRARTPLRTRISRSRRRQQHGKQRRPVLPSHSRLTKKQATRPDDFLLSSGRHTAAKAGPRLASPRFFLRSHLHAVTVPFLARPFRAHGNKRPTSLAHGKRPSSANAHSPHLETVRNTQQLPTGVSRGWDRSIRPQQLFLSALSMYKGEKS